jgi:hypothetical protein
MDPAGAASDETTATTTTTAADASLPSSPAAMLQHDIPCLRCGYNLRGLSGDGLCPECATPITASVIRFVEINVVIARPLAAMPRAWVKKLATGCTMLAVLGVAVFVVTTVQLLFDPSWRHAWTPIQIFMVIAFWLLAWPEPSAVAARTADRALRWSVGVGALICAAWMILRMSLMSVTGARAAAPLYALFAAGTTVAFMFHLARLAARLQRHDLRLEAAALMVLLSIGTFWQVLFVPAIMFPSGRRWWTLPEPVIGEAAALILVPYAMLLGYRWDVVLIFWTLLAVLMLWTLTLLFRFAMALWRAVAARRTEDVAS